MATHTIETTRDLTALGWDLHHFCAKSAEHGPSRDTYILNLSRSSKAEACNSLTRAHLALYEALKKYPKYSILNKYYTHVDPVALEPEIKALATAVKGALDECYEQLSISTFERPDYGDIGRSFACQRADFLKRGGRIP